MVGDMMKLIFMGTPEFAVPILTMLQKKHQVMLVVTQPDKPVGRKKTLNPTPVKVKAMELGIPVFQPIKLKDDYKTLIDLKPDYLITAAYGQMLPKALIEEVTCLNVHGSLLPKYRGGAPIQYALFDGQKETGVTIMYMAYQMDSGDIIKQASLPILPEDNYQTLSKRLSNLGSVLLEDVLKDLEKGVIYKKPQDPKDVSFAYTIKPYDEYLDFHQTTQNILNKIRGLSPEPGATARIKNIALKFYKAEESDIIDSKAHPGTIVFSKKRLTIKTLDGAIDILEIQAPGKKQMAIKDFLNGQNLLTEGDQFDERGHENG
jgi:methionyl-tRNA formyltransferase